MKHKCKRDLSLPNIVQDVVSTEQKKEKGFLYFNSNFLHSIKLPDLKQRLQNFKLNKKNLEFITIDGKLNNYFNKNNTPAYSEPKHKDTPDFKSPPRLQKFEKSKSLLTLKPLFRK